MNTIGTIIKRLRLQKNLTQRDMCKYLDMSQAAYSRLESNYTQVSIARLNQIAKVFKIEVPELIYLNKITKISNLTSVGYFKNPKEQINYLRSVVENLIENKETIQREIIVLKKHIAKKQRGL